LKILIIQTAFIGDVILATPLIEVLHQAFPHAQIDMVVRSGNEGLLQNFVGLNSIIIWNKNQHKTKNLFQVIKQIRNVKYDEVINIQRFFSTGLITLLSRGKNKTGFDKNPLSIFFNRKVKHEIEGQESTHEIYRNLALISHLTSLKVNRPVLYPSVANFEKVNQYKSKKYYCLAPTSVWFTKQLPSNKWIELIELLVKKFGDTIYIYLIGAPSDFDACEKIRLSYNYSNVQNLAGKLSLMDTAALVKDSEMNYVNDSAPMHISSAMNAPVTSFFCSTIPQFGFGPLSDVSKIVELNYKLDCRPCGLHGFKECPQKHFKCGNEIEITSHII